MNESEKRVAKFYDRHWSAYVPHIEPCRKHVEMFFCEGEIAGTYVLDAGCGTAVFSRVFAEKGACMVAALDVTERSLIKAKVRAGNLAGDTVSFVRGTMLRLPFRDELFDLVWAWGAVHHTECPDRALSELCRVVKPGGVLFLAVYLKTGLTWVHEFIRKNLIRLPCKTHRPVAAVMALVAAPFVALFKKREKSRKGETLQALIHDFYFTPLRHHTTPAQVTSLLNREGFQVETFVGASGRFDSTSNFIVKARRTRKPSNP